MVALWASYAKPVGAEVRDMAGEYPINTPYTPPKHPLNTP
jgi:hypothetical protein